MAALDSELVRRFIRTFAGYGHCKAPYWFIGMEEACEDDPKELQHRLELWDRRGGKQFEDLQEFHSETSLRHCFAPTYRAQPTWSGIAMTALAIRRMAINRESMRWFLSSELGSNKGYTALLELFPLPAPGLGSWPWRTLTDLHHLRERDSYKSEVSGYRIDLLRALIGEHSPKAIVMYGRTYEPFWIRVAGAPSTQIDKGRWTFETAHPPLMFMISHFTRGVTNDSLSSLGRRIADSTD